MKKVLCFGDSNTYGFIPENGNRYSKDFRWTGILQKFLGKDFMITEAGCNNRTAFQNNPSGKEFTGYKILPKYLNDTYDIVILFIGINDVQKIYNTNYDNFKTGISNLIEQTYTLCPKCKIILLSPLKLTNKILSHSFFSKLFDDKSIEKSQYLPEIYKQISEEYSCELIDLNNIVETSSVDGLHLSQEAHYIIAEQIYKIVFKLSSGSA